MIKNIFAFLLITMSLFLLGATPKTNKYPDSGYKADNQSCDLYQARDMCCPVWCAKKEDDQWKAASAVSSCAKGYSCDWPDAPGHISFQCDSKC